MKSFARIVVFVFLIVGGSTAQQPASQPAAQGPQAATPKEPYTSDKAQLSVKQEAILQLTASADQKAFQDHMKDLQTQWQAEEVKVNAWVEAVKKDNGWDETYTYDRVGDKWTHTPKVKKPAETKPAAAPKK